MPHGWKPRWLSRFIRRDDISQFFSKLSVKVNYILVE
jgi:hypothetical protein